MKRKLALSCTTFLLSCALVGGSTFAWFTASANNSSNTVTAATFELGVPTAAQLSVTDRAPGDSGQFTINVANNGTLPMGSIDMTTATSFTDGEVADEIDYDADSVIGNSADLADVINVTANFGDTSVSLPDPNGDGVTTLTELESSSVTLPGLAAGANSDLVFSWHFEENAGNDYQADNLTIDVNFNAQQNAFNTYQVTNMLGQWMPEGTALADLSGTDDMYTSYSLPFNFNFYGQNQNTVYVSTNGLLTFGSGTGNWGNSIGGLQNMAGIAPLWDDWTTWTSGDDVSVFVAPSSDHITFTWRVHHYSSGWENLFQAVLYSDGRIQYNYAVDGECTATVGISKGDGTHFNAWDVNQTVANTSTMIAPQ